MEDQMELVGAIGVEDKLQDGVKDTLVALGQAGIKVQSNLRISIEQKRILCQEFWRKMVSKFEAILEYTWRVNLEQKRIQDTASAKIRREDERRDGRHADSAALRSSATPKTNQRNH